MSVTVDDKGRIVISADDPGIVWDSVNGWVNVCYGCGKPVAADVVYCATCFANLCPWVSDDGMMEDAE